MQSITCVAAGGHLFLQYTDCRITNADRMQCLHESVGTIMPRNQNALRSS